MRHSGIQIIGDVPWGTHFCQFYQDQHDLIDILVPYFKAGLENNEFCMWITSEPLGVEAAQAALAKEVPDLEGYRQKGQIEILDYSQWYTAGGRFEADRVLQGWVDKLEDATRRGFDGLRLTGNTFWLEKPDWHGFIEYEATVDGVIGQYRMLAICTYSLAKCGAAEIMDVVANHSFALIKRAGQWQVIESAETRRVEASLRESEDRYSELFASMDEGFALCEMIYDESGQASDFRYLVVNPAFSRLTGLPVERVVGRTIKELIPGIEPFWIETYARIVQTGQSQRIENPVARLGKHYEVHAWRSSPGRFTALFSDVTERKREAEKLHRLNRTLRAHSRSDQAIFHATGEAEYLQDVCKVIVEDCGHAMVWVGFAENDEAKSVRPVAYSGFEEGYLESLRITWADAERGRGPTGTAIRTGRVCTCRNMLTDPRFLPWREEAIRRGYASSIALPLMAGDTAFGALTVYSREAGVFSEEEEKLLTELAGDFAHGINVLRLRAANAQAEEALQQAQKLESIGLLAGGIAHDFNNLLVGIIGNASLAEEMLPRASPAVEILRRIIKSGEQAAHLTRQMLAYAGKGRFVLEAVNLSELAGEASSLIESSISRKITIRLKLEPHLPAVESDPGQMQQIIMNLILNAAEAIGGNAGVISISTGDMDVDAAYVRNTVRAWAIEPGRYVFLEVRDTGCGMNEATKAKIFDPFFTTKFQGRGLGLAAVAGIVRAHKGAIQVETAPGLGATFRVLLPAMPESTVVSAPLARGDEDLRGEGTVLVVDDEEVVRDLAQYGLKRQGYEVLVAASGSAALDILRSDGDRVSLVVLDLGMPGMSGEETLPLLRKLKPGLEVIISSGYAEAEALQPFSGTWVSGFIQKPYTVQELARKVKSVLEPV